MRNCYTWLLGIVLLFNFAFAQDARIKGKVIDFETGEPIPNVNIVILGTTLGTSTDLKGEFEIRVKPGSYIIEARSIGYQSEKREIDIKGGIVFVEFRLKQGYVELGEVEVLADYKSRRVVDVRPSIIEVEPQNVKVGAGFGEDVFRMLRTLPGVLSPSDFAARFVVRGGSPDENLIIIDGVEIYNPYRLYGFVSMFNPDIVSSFNFMAGGFPAKYGDRLSAVLDVSGREGTREKLFSSMMNVNLTNANLIFEGKLPLNGSWIFSTRRTYYDLILGPIAEKTGLVSGDVTFPNFYDFQTKLSFQPFNKHKVNFFLIHSRDAMNIITGKNLDRPDSVTVNDLSYNNTLAFNWTYSPQKNFVIKFLTSWYKNSGESKFGGELLDPSQDADRKTISDDAIFFKVETWSNYSIQKFTTSVDVSYEFGRNLVEFGVGNSRVISELKYVLKLDEALKMFLISLGFFSAPEFFRYVERYNRSYFYIQDRIKLSSKLIVQPGLRFDYYEIIKRSYISPRFNFLYNIDALTSLRLAYGWYYQSPGYEKIYDQNIFFDFTRSENLNAEKATHYIVGLERWLSADILARVEGYYKNFDDLIVRKRVNGTRWVADRIPAYPPTDIRGWSPPYQIAVDDSVTPIPVNRGDGKAYGFEVFIEKKQTRNSKIHGWFSYSFSVARRKIYDVELPFIFDQRHTVNIVLNWKISRKFDLSMTWMYGSNYPYTEPIGVKPRIFVSDTAVKIMTIRNKVVLDLDYGGFRNFLNSRKPPYHRLDVRITYNARFWGANWSFYLDVMNVYNRKNVVGYDFSISNGQIKRRPVTMLPILPTLGISVKF
ncbi:MAG: TonB-dependent receptor [Candidatus Kryptonium sp.]|nr:TonB-dependent receptor [Candidatus Kryptonium sp.]MCX7762946.1 TonB-dependent receptor [Candidatus Kryptonium sp.]MDW8109733.1 TonB-dependent receptor [Candidatus Kryptonium sp.]